MRRALLQLLQGNQRWQHLFLRICRTRTYHEEPEV